jgi:hypothetical protein
MLDIEGKAIPARTTSGNHSRRRYVAQWRTRDREAILDELDRVAAEYAEAQREWESARVRLQGARERFAGFKRIASDMLAFDWYRWQAAHSNVRYAAMTVGPGDPRGAARPYLQYGA